MKMVLWRSLRGGILAISACTVFGCATLPTQQEAAMADYGSYPNNYEEITKNYYSHMLKDPDSAKYQSITTPKKFWMGNRFEGAKYGYLVCATVNGKNSYGGYVGYSTDGLLIRNGSVIDYIEKGRLLNGNNVCY